MWPRTGAHVLYIGETVCTRIRESLVKNVPSRCRATPRSVQAETQPARGLLQVLYCLNTTLSPSDRLFNVSHRSSNMDLDSPKTPSFPGLKDFSSEFIKANAPPRARPAQEGMARDGLPFISEKEEYRDSGIFFSSVDSTPEPREADANFIEFASDSTEGSENTSFDDSRELCSPDVDFEGNLVKSQPSCQIQSFLNPLQTQKLTLDDLTAGPPILDLTKLMMQPVRSGGSPAKSVHGQKTILPESLLGKVTATVRRKVEAGEKLSTSPITQEPDSLGALNFNLNTVNTEQVDPNLDNEENYLLKVDLIEEGKSDVKQRKRGRKMKNETISEDSSSKRNKCPPNYFVAVQITNQEIHNNVETVQKHVEKMDEKLAAAFVRIPTLHLTLHVSNLAEDGQLSRAKAALDCCRERLLSQWAGESAPLLHVVGLGSFGNRVMFAKLEQGPDLESLKHIADTVTDCFHTEDIACMDPRGFQPHITIMKLSKTPKLRKMGIKKINPESYAVFEECDFGWQRVLGLQLCSMTKPKDQHGYYHVDHSIEFVVPDGEPADGSAGKSAVFRPRPISGHPVKAVVQLEQELSWNFHLPRDEA